MLQFVEGAEAKAAFGLVQNWEALKAVTQALMDAESISGDQLRSIMEVHGAQSFPDPFVEGFGWDENGDVVYPGSAAAGTDKVCPPPAPPSFPLLGSDGVHMSLPCFVHFLWEVHWREVGTSLK